jgi:hypothetical protein
MVGELVIAFLIALQVRGEFGGRESGTVLQRHAIGEEQSQIRGHYAPAVRLSLHDHIETIRARILLLLEAHVTNIHQAPLRSGQALNNGCGEKDELLGGLGVRLDGAAIDDLVPIFIERRVHRRLGVFQLPLHFGQPPGSLLPLLFQTEHLFLTLFEGFHSPRYLAAG